MNRYRIYHFVKESGLRHSLCIGLLLVSSTFLAGQDSLSTEKTERSPVTHSDVDILGDTRGVNLGPYLKGVVRDVQVRWHDLVPVMIRGSNMKHGDVTVEFFIMKDGSVRNMRLVSSSGDINMDRAAWGGIQGSSPFSPLPREFDKNFLQLRFHFQYGPERKKKGDSKPKSSQPAPPN